MNFERCSWLASGPGFVYPLGNMPHELNKQKNKEKKKSLETTFV